MVRSQGYYSLAAALAQAPTAASPAMLNRNESYRASIRCGDRNQRILGTTSIVPVISVGATARVKSCCVSSVSRAALAQSASVYLLIVFLHPFLVLLNVRNDPCCLNNLKAGRTLGCSSQTLRPETAIKAPAPPPRISQPEYPDTILVSSELLANPYVFQAEVMSADAMFRPLVRIALLEAAPAE